MTFTPDNALVYARRSHTIRRTKAATKQLLAQAPNREAAWCLLLDVLADPCDEVMGMTLWSLLLACRNTGPEAADVILGFIGATRSTTVATIRSPAGEPIQKYRLLRFVLRAGSLTAVRYQVGQLVRGLA